MAIDVSRETNAPLRPPRATSGPIAWLRDNLFSSVTNSMLTLIGLYLVYVFLRGLIDWAFLSAIWNGPGGVYVSGWRVWELVTEPWETKNAVPCRQEGSGACWPFIANKFPQFIYGRFPFEERWRVDLSFLMLFVGAVWLMVPRIPGKLWGALFTFFLMPLLIFWLLNGSGAVGLGWPDYLGFALAVVGIGLLVDGRRGPGALLGPSTRQGGGLALLLALPFLVRFLMSTSGLVHLPEVKTELWGGLLVTLVVALVGLTGAFPIGIILALGRRSRMPLVRWASVTFIEFVRGVPLITILFMSSVMLPLFLPEGVTFDKLLRALIGVMLFQGAYMAETIRGGLQAIPRGQFEAADALGLSYRLKMTFIILPQALKLVIPGIVNSFVGLFKDTSLVLIIGLFDLLGIVQLNSNADPNWSAPTTNMTGYVFAAAIFWFFCYGISRYSQSVERRLSAGERK
jgi:general L-amino acid transport system permease protein